MHESRLPLTRPALNSTLDYIQVQLNLPRGINGGWSEQADDRLANMLGKQKRGSAARPMPLALLDAPAGTRPEQAPQPGSAKDSSSSESPEAGSAKDSSSSEEGSRKRKSSSSSSSSSTRKSKLRNTIRQLTKDVTELAEGLQSQQNLEEENQRLVALADGLAAENQMLRSALET